MYVKNKSWKVLFSGVEKMLQGYDKKRPRLCNYLIVNNFCCPLNNLHWWPNIQIDKTQKPASCYLSSIMRFSILQSRECQIKSYSSHDVIFVLGIWFIWLFCINPKIRKHFWNLDSMQRYRSGHKNYLNAV